MARWIKHTGMGTPEARGSYYCSKCYNTALRDWFKMSKYTVLSNYCPYCGESMENASEDYAEDIERNGGVI